MNKKSINKTNRKNIGALPQISGILPPINNYSSRLEWESACWQKILKSKELLRLLITSHERRNLVMRVAALNRLIAGRSYRQIGEELWLSPQTISGIKKALKEKSYRSYLERSKKERKKREYSSIPAPFKPRPRGRPHRTKYGTIYMPYWALCYSIALKIQNSSLYIPRSALPVHISTAIYLPLCYSIAVQEIRDKNKKMKDKNKDKR